MTTATPPAERVLLVPGLTCDEAAFAPQIKALGALGWQCEVADVTQGGTIDEMASLILSSSPGRSHVVGLSMGGYVAMALARQAPGRVRSLTLIGSSARGDTDEQRTSRRRLVEQAQTGGFDGVIELLLTVFLSGYAPVSLRHDVEAMIRRVGPHVFARQQLAIAHRPDARPTLRLLEAPILVVCGENDRINPPEVSEEIAVEVKDGRVELIPGTGHLCNLEAPEATNELLIDFITSRTP